MKNRKGAVSHLVVALAVIAVVLVAAIVGLLVISKPTRTTPLGTQSGTAATVASNDTELGAFAPPAVYQGLGYPKQTVGGYINGEQVNSSYIFGYRLSKFGLDAATVYAPVMNLSEAVMKVASAANLAPGNYSLSSAEFDPGLIVNGTVSVPASWTLMFAQVYDGFWLYGGTTFGYSITSTVDTTTGSVRSFSYPAPTPVPGTYKLKVSSSQALQSIRDHGAVGSVPSVLALEGNVTSMRPMIVMFGPSQYGGYFDNPLDPSLNGQERLCWVIEMTETAGPGGGGYQGTFSVDAETGQLLSAWSDQLFPASNYGGVTGNWVLPSAKNITVSQETFQLDTQFLGQPTSATVVPQVFWVRPGTTASIELSSSNSFSNVGTLTLAFANPLPGLQNLSNTGLPPSVSARLSDQTLAFQGAGSLLTNVSFSVAPTAPSGTYLLEILGTANGSNSLWLVVPFFLSVWNGTGPWPAPPH
jgi:hypothetical protein